MRGHAPGPGRTAWALLSLLAACAAVPAPEPPAAAADLAETYWRLTEIDGTAVATRAGTREPHLVFRREGARVSGFAGCNTISGAYQLDAGRLRFGPLAMTRMACASADANAREAAFTKALVETVSQRITGGRLELLDVSAAVRARLEARPPK